MLNSIVYSSHARHVSTWLTKTCQSGRVSFEEWRLCLRTPQCGNASARMVGATSCIDQERKQNKSDKSRSLQCISSCRVVLPVGTTTLTFSCSFVLVDFANELSTALRLRAPFVLCFASVPARGLCHTLVFSSTWRFCFSRYFASFMKKRSSNFTESVQPLLGLLLQHPSVPDPLCRTPLPALHLLTATSLLELGHELVRTSTCSATAE